jgi:putative hydrolase of the HAD superfamily
MTSLVLLDLDGTLLDGSGLPGAMRATCEVLADDLPDVTADDLVAANTAVWQQLWPEVEDDYMLGGAGDRIGAEAWRRTLARCGVHDDDALGTAIAEWDRQERGTFRLFPDVLPVLDALEAGGVRVGMVTNGAAAVQRLKLDVVGLADRFDPLVISSEVGVRKPDPAVFEIALTRAGLPAAEAVYVGDNLWHDIPGARTAGLRTVWLDRNGVALQPDWPQPGEVIGSLADLR